jgi:AbrB family looped-hinge helix DNA binding protein
MTEYRVKIAENGRMVLPASVREALGIRKGGDVVLTLDERGVTLRSLDQTIRDVQRLAKKYFPRGKSVVDEFLAERRAEAEHE